MLGQRSQGPALFSGHRNEEAPVYAFREGGGNAPMGGKPVGERGVCLCS